MKRMPITRALFLSAIFWTLPFFASATTPTISNVSGTVATGQTLTITGTNLVQENTANWYGSSYFPGVSAQNLAYFSGQSGNIPETIVSPGIVYYGTTGQGVYDSANKVMTGSVSAKVTTSEQCTSGTSCGGSRIDITSQNRDANFCASSYIKFHGPFATEYQKFFLTGPDAQYYLFQRVNGDGTASGMAIKDGAMGDGYWVQYGSFQWTPDVWHYWELCVDATHYSGDRYTVWWDGVQSFQYTFAAHSGAGNWYVELGVPNWSNSPGAPTQQPFTMWINRYVTSSTQINPATTIELSGDGSNWKWQEPTSLSDTSETIKLDLSGLTGTNYQLRVTNNLQQTSAVYNLSGSPVVRADVDNNSVTNTTDALLTLRNSLGMDMSTTAWYTGSTTGDVDCSGSCNSTDALLILRYSLGMNMGSTAWCAG